MYNEFVTYQMAVAMKELGFDNTTCLGVYYGDFDELERSTEYGGDPLGFALECRGTQYYAQKGWKDGILAPTYHQAFKWFKKEFGLHPFVDISPREESPERCWFMIRYMDRERGDEDYMSGWFDNQDDAEPACVNKLVELAKKERDEQK